MGSAAGTEQASFTPPRAPGWPLERVLHLMAGTVVLTSAVLVYLFGPWWLILTVFVGLSLLLDAFAGWCPASLVLYRLGVRTSAECGMQRGSGPRESAVPQ